MIVRTLDELKETGRYAEKAGHWSSARYLLRDDNVGFTMTQTTVAAGSVMDMQYKNHIEANLIIAGEATVTDLETDLEYELGAGSKALVVAVDDGVFVIDPELPWPEDA